MKGISASSWTITKNHCMMHGQQNVKLITTVYVAVGLAGSKTNWENWKDIGSEHIKWGRQAIKSTVLLEKGKGTLANRKGAFTWAMFYVYNKMLLYNINVLTVTLYYKTCIHNSSFLGTSNFCHFQLTGACII